MVTPKSFVHESTQELAVQCRLEVNNCQRTFKKCDDNIECVHDFSLIDPFITRREQARKASGERNLKHKNKKVFIDSLINSTIGNLLYQHCYNTETDNPLCS